MVKRDYKGFFLSVFWRPRSYLVFIFVLGVVVWTIDNYWKEKRRITWEETQATLVDIQMSDRIRNKNKEYFLKLTFEYKVGDKSFRAYSDQSLTSYSQEDSKTRELKETKSQTTIYYNVHNPTDATFDIQQTKADDNILFVLIPSMIMVGGLGYWRLRNKYGKYLRT